MVKYLEETFLRISRTYSQKLLSLAPKEVAARYRAACRALFSSDAPDASTVAGLESAWRDVLRTSLGPRLLSSEERAARLSALSDVAVQVASCTACPLRETRTRPVPGKGHPGARLFLLGEGPGRNEDLKGQPFVGRAGEILDGLLSLLGLSRTDVYVTNVVKCRAADGGRDRQPLPHEVAACRNYLKVQLLVVAPDLVVVMGNTALRWFDPEASVGRMHGRVLEVGGWCVYPVYHPASVLYRSELREVLEEDFLRLPKVLGEVSGA